MNLPFFYPEHPEFKAHVEYVKRELWRFRNAYGLSSEEQRWSEAECMAKDIMLHITSHEATWWERLLSKLRGERTVDMFEAGLEKWLREAIERARVRTQEVLSDETERRVVGFTTADLLRELGINDASDGRNGGV